MTAQEQDSAKTLTLSWNAEEWETAAQLYAFIGNSLLTPMSRTESVGLDPAFWNDLATLFDGALAEPALALAQFAESKRNLDRAKAVQQVSVEFTHLFVGPPRPAASPWETMNGAVETSIGFGLATSQMKALLREMGLSVQNENNQYEDHMGIELLYASELCRRIAAADGREPTDLAVFLDDHPRQWVGRFTEKVRASRPDGYFVLLLEYAHALMAL